MTIFKSCQVNLDPEPWEHGLYGRAAEKPTWRIDAPHETSGWTLNPRPEFEPTRDPEPWAAHEDALDWQRSARRHDPDYTWWAPRREQFDTPVNPILVEFRLAAAAGLDWALSQLLDALTLDLTAPEAIRASIRSATPDQIDHARRVLTRLADLNTNGAAE